MKPERRRPHSGKAKKLIQKIGDTFDYTFSKNYHNGLLGPVKQTTINLTIHLFFGFQYDFIITYSFIPITHTSSTCSKLPFHSLKALFKISTCFFCGKLLFLINRSENCLYLNFLPFGPPN